MKKGIAILVLGLALAVAAFGSVYLACTASAHRMEHCGQPELAWLKEEFHLTDAEFKRISDLHAAYLPQCAEMCQKVDAENQRLKGLLANAHQMTPEIEASVAECARLRGECQRRMLNHFFEVSRTMPPDEGRHYLAWVQEKTCLATGGMMDGK